MSLRNFGGAEKAGHKVMEKRQVTKKLPLYNEMIQSWFGWFVRAVTLSYHRVDVMKNS